MKGKKLGFTLAEIYDLITSRERANTPQDDAFESPDLTVSLGKDQIATQIAHLERQRAELDAAIAELKVAHERMHEPAV